jgi:drug/metabolite transporter (DMT)-like permease
LGGSSIAVEGTIRTFPSGAGLALLSAVLFGASTPFAKLLLRDVDPWMLAGVLYLGSGLGLVLLRFAGCWVAGRPRQEARLRGSEWIWLGLAIASGGVVGPVLLMVGLARTPAAAAALPPLFY